MYKLLLQFETILFFIDGVLQKIRFQTEEKTEEKKRQNPKLIGSLKSYQNFMHRNGDIYPSHDVLSCFSCCITLGREYNEAKNIVIKAIASNFR